MSLVQRNTATIITCFQQQNLYYIFVINVCIHDSLSFTFFQKQLTGTFPSHTFFFLEGGSVPSVVWPSLAGGTLNPGI